MSRYNQKQSINGHTTLNSTAWADNTSTNYMGAIPLKGQKPNHFKLNKTSSIQSEIQSQRVVNS